MSQEASEPISYYIAKYAFIGSVLFFSFAAGLVIAYYELFPYGYVSDSLSAVAAMKKKRRLTGNRYVPYIWKKSRTSERGMVIHEPQASYDGVTLFTPLNEQAAYLVDMQGQIVHKWQRPFREIWEQPHHIIDPVPQTHVHYRKLHLFPNGDLLVILAAAGDTPYGYGLVKLDKDSNVIWAYAGNVHHDFDVAPDGRIYALTQDIRDADEASPPCAERPYIDDSIVVLTPDGREIDRLRVFDAVRSARMTNILRYSVKCDDPFHTNSVSYVTAEMAAGHADLVEGELLISVRNVHALLAVNLESRAATWALRGGWRKQHDADILANGHILLFDNQGNVGPSLRSRVIEFDPRDQRIAWQYSGDDQKPLVSKTRASQQRLPNGNTLITESNGGRLVEVTRDGRIVWEYIMPTRGGQNDELIPNVCSAERYRIEDLAFLRR
jgi:hypothetical protein